MTALPRVADGDLDGLSGMVRTVLDCDAVIIAIWGRGGTATVGVSGTDRAAARTVADRFHPDRAAARDELTDTPAPVTDGDRPSVRSLLAGIGFGSVFRSALTWQGDVVGLLFALSHDDRRPDPALVTALVRSCESALEFDRDHTSPGGVSEIDALALHTESFRELIPAIQQVVSAAVGPVSIGLSVLDEETGLLATADGSFGLSTEVTDRFAIDPGDLHSNAARVFEVQRPFASNHVIGDPAVLQDYPIAFGIESMIAVPLVVSGRSTGVLMVANKSAGFDANDVATATGLAPQVAVAVELARLNEAKRLRFVIEHTVGLIRTRTADPVVDPGCFAEALARLRVVVRADRVRLATPDRVVVSVDSPTASIPALQAPQFTMDKTCGVWEGSPLRLRLSRTHGYDFSPGQHRVVQRVADLVAEGLARTRSLRQEVELAQHRERRRIADDLHDDVAQLLFAAHLALEDIPDDDPIAVRSARRAADLVGQAEAALRDAILVLNPPPRTLSAALTEVVDTVRAQWDLPVDLSVDTSIDGFVSSEATAELARAAREALVNVAKHAGPCRATVTTRIAGDEGGVVTLEVRDNGCGGAAAPPEETGPHHGLWSMRQRVRERGGVVSITSGDTEGTTVSVRLPLTVSGPIGLTTEE